MVLAALWNNVDGYHFQKNLLPLVWDKGFHRFVDNHVRDYMEAQNRKPYCCIYKNRVVKEKSLYVPYKVRKGFELIEVNLKFI